MDSTDREMNMKATLCLTPIFLAFPCFEVLAQDISAGSRVTIFSDWHDANGGPYSPNVVECPSSSGLCLRDKRLTPPERHLIQIDGGLQITYREFETIYIFQEGGRGKFFNLDGQPVGQFTWSQ